MSRDRDGRADARRRQRRRDGRRDDRDGDVVRIREAVRPGQNVGRRAADIAAGDHRVARGTRAHAEPDWRARRDRRRRAWRCSPGRRSRFSRRATRSSSRAAARARPDLRRQSLHDRDRRAAHGGVAAARPISADSLDELVASLDEARRARRRRLLGRQLGRRSRSDSGRAGGARRDSLSRHRREARQADGASRIVGGTPVFAHARLSDVVPVERLHAAGAVPARSRATAALAAAHRRRAARAAGSSRRPAGCSSTPCGSSTAVAEPAFKASGDITSMANADGYIEIPPEADAVDAGTDVTVKLF